MRAVCRAAHRLGRAPLYACRCTLSNIGSVPAKRAGTFSRSFYRKIGGVWILLVIGIRSEDRDDGLPILSGEQRSPRFGTLATCGLELAARRSSYLDIVDPVL